MKKFTLFFILLAFGFINQSLATKAVKVSQFITPTNGSNVTVGIPFNVTFCIQNSGDEILAADDNINFKFGQVVHGNLILNTATYVLHTPHKVLNLLDTITVVFPLQFNYPSPPGIDTLFFGAGVANSYSGTTFYVNVLGSGIDDAAKSISKVWYSNSAINYELTPKVNCEAKLNITSLSGQLIKSQTLNFQNDSQINETLYLGDIHKGIYIISILTPYGTETKKFVVQ